MQFTRGLQAVLNGSRRFTAPSGDSFLIHGRMDGQRIDRSLALVVRRTSHQQEGMDDLPPSFDEARLHFA